MNRKTFFAVDTAKRKMGIAILCCVLIIAMGTGMAFAANANTDAKPIVSTTAVSDTSPSVIAEQYANRFEQYKGYGLTYDKAEDKLYFDGKLVRYFEDYYPVGDNAYAGVDYFNENGTIDVHGVRDLTQIIHNADGSYDPSGTLVGVEQYSLSEFDARDIEKLKNPPQAYTVCVADNASYTAPQGLQQNNDGQINNATTYAIADENASDNKGETFAEKFLKYKDYGITFSEKSINGGIGNVYYQGQMVRRFADITPEGGAFTLSSSDGGEIAVRTTYDAKGKLVGIEIISD